MRKITLEQRVARLEKLLFKKSVKNEDLRNPDLEDEYDDEWDEDEYDDDEWDEDEYDESHKRTSRKSVKNEDAKMMPNGMIANRVSDVLSGWAEVSRNDVNGALKALDRAGALDRACNRWYPTVDDVMAAVEDCWDDPIAMVGNGAAQFFISNNGDCALILQPIAGGTSRARQITLKFHWDV